MTDLNTKKWFIYVGDKHEGPYSLLDVQQKMAQGVVTSQHYVWCDGMGDWKVMTEVPDFSAVLSGGTPAAAPAPAAYVDQAAAPAFDPANYEPQSYSDEPVAAASPTQMFGAPRLSYETVVQEQPAELNTGAFAAPAAVSAAPKAQATAGKSAFGSSNVAVMDNEKTGDINPKERKRLEKEAKKAAKLAEKERKIREKLEAKEAKARAKQAQLLGVGSGGVSARGGERIAPKLIKLLFIVLAIAGVGAAYIQGYLNPVLENPAVQSSLDLVKSSVRPYIRMAVEKVPALGAFLSPIPSLEDVDPIEYDAMKQAALAHLEIDGPRIAIGLSLEDPLKPKFYLATNLPDGVVLDVYVIGVPETLLNQLKYVAFRKVQVAQNFAQVEPLDLQGKPVPRGTYRVFVTDSAQQSPEAAPLLAGMAPVKDVPDFIPEGRKAFVSGAFFLGGKKDATYAERLKIYHDSLQKVAVSELTELKQVYATFNSQLASTLSKFQALRKGRITPASKNAWAAFDKPWSGMMGQFAQTFQSWSPDFLEGRFFHWRLYGLVKSAGSAIMQVHDKQRQFFDGGAQDPNFDAVYGQFVTEAQGLLGQLQQGISQVESTAPSPNGMPARL